jgi:hypothetical protein
MPQPIQAVSTVEGLGMVQLLSASAFASYHRDAHTVDGNALCWAAGSLA